MLAAVKGWKTILINGLIVLASVAAYVDAAGVGQYFPEGGRYAWVPMAIGILNIVLRAVTTTPVFKKD